MVPIFFDFVSRKITGWSSWVDKELSNGEFVNCLECVGILKSIAISKNLEGFKDAKALDTWCIVGVLLSTHSSFLLVSSPSLWRTWLIISFFQCLVRESL